jgi:hypothetical protein
VIPHPLSRDGQSPRGQLLATLGNGLARDERCAPNPSLLPYLWGPFHCISPHLTYFVGQRFFKRPPFCGQPSMIADKRITVASRSRQRLITNQNRDRWKVNRGFYSRETKVCNTNWIRTMPFRICVKLQSVVNCGCHRAQPRSVFALLACYDAYVDHDMSDLGKGSS